MDARPIKLTPEKLSELKNAVRQRLKQLGVDEEVRRVVKEGAATSGFTKEKAMDALQEKGLISQLIKSLGDPEKLLQPPAEPSDNGSSEPNQHRRYLSVQVRRGRAFAPCSPGPEEGATLQLHAELMGCRFRSGEVPISSEPDLEASALVELPGTLDTDPLSLVSHRQPLRLVVVRTDPEDDKRSGPRADGCPGRRIAVGCASVEWRRALTAGLGRRVQVVAELAPGASWRATGVLGPSPFDGAGTPAVGAVEVMLEILPPLAKPMEAVVLRKKLQAEAESDAGKVSGFAARARDWWSRYVAINPPFRERLIKVLAHGEDGVQRPVCAYVRPLRLGRSLSSAREAARWISLLARREDQVDAAIFGGTSRPAEAWSSLHTVLVTRSASKEDRAALLCRLLLGCAPSPCREASELGDDVRHLDGGKSATFWEPATGERFNATGAVAQQGGLPYYTVDCIFNHCRLYANRQLDNSTAAALYHLQDSALWCELRVHPREDVPGTIDDKEPRLEPPTADVATAEVDAERYLRIAVEHYRWNSLGLPKTTWSPDLAFLSMPALDAYEQEAATGLQAAGNEEFQQAVKRMVPTGCIFKGFPMHFTHHNGALMGDALLAEPAAQEMLTYSDQETEFGIRVKVIPYPEGVVSAWAMLCVKHPA